MRLLLLSLTLWASLGAAQAPHQFTPGTPARADEVNANNDFFWTLMSENRQAILSTMGGIELTNVFSEDIGVAVALCPVDTLPISASCVCDNNGGLNNLGVLFACPLASDGAVVGCFDDGWTFDPGLPGTLAQVEVVCAQAILNDGTAVPPVISKGTVPEISKLTGEEETADDLAVEAHNARSLRSAANP